MSKVTIDLDVSGHIDIVGIGQKEEKTITFSTDGGWGTDQYELSVYNSQKKNEVKVLANAIELSGNDMTLTFSPEVQEIPLGENYYELVNKTTKTVEFKGLLKIDK